MSKPLYLSWENFRSTVLLYGQQRVHRVTDAPFVGIFGDGDRNIIGIWLEIAAGTSVPPRLSSLECIKIRTFNQSGRFLLEVTTNSHALQRQFYHFAVAVAERVIVENRTATDSVDLELHCFTALLEEKSLLGIERQIGLIGELVFLEYLLEKAGMEALDSWLGPAGEPHDFRLQKQEFEVKTTVSPHRIHTIHGSEQLIPTKGCSLYLISVMLGPAGAGDGFSLSEKVAQLLGRFQFDEARLKQFTIALESIGYRSEDSAQYLRKFSIRRPMGLVPIDENFPAVTRQTIQNALGALALRIESLQYDVNVEGLENEEGTAEFEATVPSLT